MSRARRGATLVLVLWLVVVLGAIAAQVTQSTRLATGIAANARAGLVARYAAESGVEATVAAIEDALAARDSSARASFLNALEHDPAAADTTALGDGLFQVAIVDVSARLDVNMATPEQLARFFSQFTSLAEAASIARAIRWRIERGGEASDERLVAGDSGAVRAVRPLRSLDELRHLRLLSGQMLQQTAPFLTVDGDGTINLAAAPAVVRAVAGGDARGEPSRLLLVSRGWQDGRPLTHEIQAVYAVSGNRLVLAHWREGLR